VLTSVSGFTGLTSVGGAVNIQSNSVLTTLDGFANLVTTGGSGFQIYANNALTSILGLIKPTGKLTTIGPTLTVYYSPSLTICQADALKTSVNPTTYNQTGLLACTSPKVCTGTPKTSCQ
jgi:hypothetical protein